MRLDDLPLELDPIDGAVQAWRADVDAAAWRAACARAREGGARLIALWGSDRGYSMPPGDRFSVHAVLAVDTALVWLTHRIAGDAFPDVSDLYPAANRMQRATFDLLGIRATSARDNRQWLRHGGWPPEYHPLRKDFDARSAFPNRRDDYPFVRVEGDGVHEIPVGPVHAGTIEPGHFRFSVLGERVLRLEERLGYTHKGIEKRFEQMSLVQGSRLAGRISGDSTVAYAWAYAMAVEGATHCVIPPRAAWLRALLLERERLANHLGDLGFLGNDAGFGFGLSQFSRLKEDMLRAHHAVFGHRYLMDAIVPGGVADDIDDAGLSRLGGQCDTLHPAIDELRRIYQHHAGVQDRFTTTGVVAPALAGALGLTGQAGRASGQPFDARIQHPSRPYDTLDVRLVTHAGGDVAARVHQRFDEAIESLRLCAAILSNLREPAHAGPVAIPLPTLDRDAAGIGFVEGWRGPVLVSLEAGAGNRIARLHAHDPSWQNWLLIEHAIIGNIVPDFPLINKSFNLSYSGHDL